uniref:Uncharacterized protein n=1 Tax=Anguilla anguilla TaxID=7936 RepID=A0A0E9W153_ANGAN
MGVSISARLHSLNLLFTPMHCSAVARCALKARFPSHVTNTPTS